MPGIHGPKSIQARFIKSRAFRGFLCCKSNFQVNFLQNHNAKLESENILLRREIENLHCQLRLRPDIWSGPGPGYHDQNQSQPAHSPHDQTHKIQEHHLSEQKPSKENSNQQSVNHMVHSVASYQTPSGVIKEINYDHRNDF